MNLRAWPAVAVMLAGLLAPGLLHAQAGDVPGSHDHPLISRYAGSTIVRYDHRKYDDYRLLTGAVVPDGASPDGWRAKAERKLEGEVTRLAYDAGTRRSTLEVLRNYREELGKAGFRILFACTKAACGGRSFNNAVVPYDLRFGDNYEDQRYLAAQGSANGKDVYVALYVDRNTNSGGPQRNHVYTELDVIEAVPMDTGMVTVDAAAMRNAIEATGTVRLYGIYFDTDRADLKPDSEPTLKQIAALLADDPKLRLYVVGHTDNQGTLAHNMDLSRRRAEAVVAALVRRYHVPAARLLARGVGPLAPVATNATETGRAKNRRVELVGR